MIYNDDAKDNRVIKYMMYRISDHDCKQLSS